VTHRIEIANHVSGAHDGFDALEMLRSSAAGNLLASGRISRWLYDQDARSFRALK